MIVCAARYNAIVTLRMNANAWQVLVAAKVVFRQIDPSSSHHTASNPRRLLFELMGADILDPEHHAAFGHQDRSGSAEKHCIHMWRLSTHRGPEGMVGLDEADFIRGVPCVIDAANSQIR